MDRARRRRLAELYGAPYAWMAAEESRRRSERVKAGLTVAATAMDAIFGEGAARET